MEGSPNFLAQASLFLWIPITVILFVLFRPSLGVLFSLVLAWMFLPEKVVFDPPVLPPFDKHGFAFASAFGAALVFCPKRIWKARPRGGLDWFVFILVGGAFGTALTNGDPLSYGPTWLPPLGLYDAISILVRDSLGMIIPFYLGKALIREARDVRNLLGILAGGAAVYSLFVLIEARFSPQLNMWVYGFHQHDFSQTLRGSGYRPMVFMTHGIAVALFTVTGMICAVALAKLKERVYTIPAVYIAPYLWVIVLVCKSLGAIIYSVVLGPLMWFTSPKTQIRFAAVLALLVFVYPVLKMTDSFPNDALVSLAQSASEERAQSLKFRFDNDTALVKKGLQRPWFGWGGFSRGRVFDEWGKDVSVTDGLWIILLNDKGIFGLVGGFGLLVGPILLAYRRWKKITDKKDRVLVATLALIVAMNGIDLLPNAINASFEYFLPGALFGIIQGLTQAGAEKRKSLRPAPVDVTAERATA